MKLYEMAVVQMLPFKPKAEFNMSTKCVCVYII